MKSTYRSTAGAMLAFAPLALLLYASARGAGPLPPLGRFFDPVHGVWQVAAASRLATDARATVPGLGANVRVLYDDRAVPHIFAATESDAYRALGYVVARDRAFQLDLQTHAASGRLTELAGARALPLDRIARQLGFSRLAATKFAALDPASPSAVAMRAYSDGVNAYLDAMPASELPLEYRLLGARPERWRPENSVHLLDRMAWMLSYNDEELRRPQIRALVGDRAADALFPRNSPLQEPIVPNGQRAARLDGASLPPPRAPDSATVAALGDGRDRLTSSAAIADLATTGDAVGSNNWAVAPKRTRDGHALLAGDPHLGLSLPSIWYEVHLVVPGKLDVYGVTIPGAPCIIIGFNRDIAWTVTNLDADFTDFFAEHVDDEMHPTRYMVDGAWRPIERRVERYLATGGGVAAVETTYFTHRGPLVRQGGRWLSTRWVALDKSDEASALLAASHATTTRTFLDATTGWVAPPQNMLVADRAGSIAIRSSGHFPIRGGDGRGDVIRDGSTSASDWRGFRSTSTLPQSIDPAQGYLASANQQPVDPRVDSTYIGASWLDPWRAMRINTLLRADSAVSPDDMRRFQTDPGSARADLFVPAILAAADRRIATRQASSAVRQAAGLLRAWDRRYTRDNRGAVLFEAIMTDLADRTWDELVPADSPPDERGHRVATPASSVLLELFADSASAWWDDRRTSAVVEHRDDIVTAAMETALARTVRAHGPAGSSGWRWSNIARANIYHSLQLRSLSALGLTVQGGPSTLSPVGGSGTHGPSWRMVVELGPEVHAWTAYPGGQSGNPASAHYRDRIAQWQAGELDSARFVKAESDLRGARRALLTLSPP